MDKETFDRLLALDGSWMAMRLLMTQVWTERIKYTADPAAELDRLSRASLATVDDMLERIEGRGPHLLMQQALAELESFWRGMEERFPPGTPPAPLLLPEDDDQPKRPRERRKPK